MIKANRSQNGKHKIKKTIELNVPNKIKSSGHNVDRNPNDPAFNFFLDHIVGGNNAHHRDKRIPKG